MGVMFVAPVLYGGRRSSVARGLDSKQGDHFRSLTTTHPPERRKGKDTHTADPDLEGTHVVAANNKVFLSTISQRVHWETNESNHLLPLLQLVAPLPVPPRIRIALAGGPVSGKGTHAPLIQRKYGCVHISIGDMIRQEIDNKTPVGRAAQLAVRRGELLDDTLVVRMLKERLAHEDCRAGYLLDGFPRSAAQADAMELEGIHLDALLVFQRPHHQVIEYATGRSSDPVSGIIYHDRFNPPPTEKVRARLQRRNDDIPVVVKKRIKMFEDTYTEIFTRWEPKTTIIDSSLSRSITQVFEDVSRALDALCPADVDEVDTMPAQNLTLDDKLIHFMEQRRTITQPFEPGALLRAMNLCHSRDTADFLPFIVDGVRVGLVGKNFAAQLSSVQNDVFDITHDSCSLDGWNGDPGSVQMNSKLLQPEVEAAERTTKVAEVTEALKRRGHIQGWRDELQPVSLHPRAVPYFNIERAAIPYFGLPAFAIHVNCFVQTKDKFLVWISTRSKKKATYAGRLDQLVAGGQPTGLSVLENCFKECFEEANIDLSQIGTLKSVGSLSYRYAVRKGLSYKNLYIFDLNLPFWFKPSCNDGEVEEFHLVTVEAAIESICAEPEAWKPNSAMVMIDFAIRHGVVTPDREPDFLAIRELMTPV